MTLFFIPILTQSQTKRALIIGIGKQKDSSWNKINGDKDVPYVLEFLDNAQYEEIITCVNELATKTGIVDAFIQLNNNCNPNDIVYIHFSGHGQQMTDAGQDEADGWDESWIPYDAYREYCQNDKGEKHLTDDEIGTMLNNIRAKIGPNGKMLVVIDACHSGSGTREFDDSDESVRGISNKFEIPDIMHQKRNVSVGTQRWITISACKDYQSNFEMTGKKVGKLTYALWHILNEKHQYTNKEFEKLIIQFMLANPNSRRIRQTPVLTESIDGDRISDILQ